MCAQSVWRLQLGAPPTRPRERMTDATARTPSSSPSIFRSSCSMSSGFRFGFLPETHKEETQSDLPVQGEPLATETKPFSWIPTERLSALYQDRTNDEIQYDEIDLGYGVEAIRGVDCWASSFVEPLSHRYDPAVAAEEIWRKRDLQAGEYEGGMKVWECSVDLLHHVARNRDSFVRRSGNILELGCGHALPACFLLRECCKERVEGHHDKPLSVVFTDYNEFVLKDVTLSNVVINTAQLDEGARADVPRVIQFGGGDWLQFAAKWLEQHPGSKFDLVLAAETLYTESAARQTAKILADLLQADSGLALVATKRYYFGVGGGSDAFRDALPINARVEVLQEFDTGSGNIRELLGVSLPSS